MTRKPSRLRRRLKWAGLAACIAVCVFWIGSIYATLVLYWQGWLFGFGGGSLGIGHDSLSPPAFSYGFYIRERVRWLPRVDRGPNYWVLRIPFYVPLALLGGAVLWLRHLDRHRVPGHCQRCGYDLTGNVSGTCPECGDAL